MVDEREVAVRGVLAELTVSWNRGDATGYARLFTEDADYVTFFGVNGPAGARSRRVIVRCSTGRSKDRG